MIGKALLEEQETIYERNMYSVGCSDPLGSEQ